MKLSIIIPVYRTQDTLQRCLESILCQPFTNYRIILVDDGSPDNAPAMCDTYAGRYENITVIHKENGGLSSARNAALESIFCTPESGNEDEYITFVDSDDTLEKGTLAPLMDQLAAHPEVDILEYSATIHYGHPTAEKSLDLSDRIYHNAAEYWLVEQAYGHTYVCNKIFRRNLFSEVRFPEGKNFEDVWVTPEIIGLHTQQAAHNICIMTSCNGGYLYYWNPSGICANASYSDTKSRYEALSLTMEHLLKLKPSQPDIFLKYDESWQRFLLDIVNALIDMYVTSGKFEDSEPLVSNTISSLPRIKHIKLRLFQILGYHNLCRILNLVHRLRCR